MIHAYSTQIRIHAWYYLVSRFIVGGFIAIVNCIAGLLVDYFLGVFLTDYSFCGSGLIEVMEY